MTTPVYERLRAITPRLDEPTVLFAAGEHCVYWLGHSESTAFRCNTYLLRDGPQAWIIDPGNRQQFPQTRERVAQILPPEALTGLILCHQDPDIAASLPDWLDLKPELAVVTSPRTEVLLGHYGVELPQIVDIEAQPHQSLASGGQLRFIPAPFLHSPMAFTTWDSVAGFLFTGDIFAALDDKWQLVVSDFARHRHNLDLFHVDYMASNIAARGFVEQVEGLPIEALLPQHGSIIAGTDVAAALDYLRELQCGLDLLYPELVGG